MNCQNCKHWVLGKCILAGIFIASDRLCNGWELSLSHEQVAAEKRISGRGQRSQPLQLIGSKDFAIDILKHRAELVEYYAEDLEKCISQLIEAGDKLGSTQFGWTDEREHWTSVVQRTKTILAKGAK